VIDESTDLPEGTEVELAKVADAFADMAPEDREELEEAIEEGFRDF
jgi:predicted DNA-binding antitoxin AbrB/MazE fold protein